MASASVSPATKANKSATPKVKGPRKPRGPALPFDKRFELQYMVKNGDPTLPDSTLAAQISEKLGHKVQQVTVAGYRKKFGIANVRKPGVASLYARIALLEKAISDAGFEVPA